MKRGRAAVRVLLPCCDCCFAQEPELRKPHHFSEEWHPELLSHFGCVGCSRRLAGIEVRVGSELR